MQENDAGAEWKLLAGLQGNGWMATLLRNPRNQAHLRVIKLAQSAEDAIMIQGAVVLFSSHIQEGLEFFLLLEDK